ncbi:hypothetical protein NMY22_g8129 [Coprinellus aureogranulatus]|nr:hypothetical protein NMY22_g8129 [Coprinellus aureogranulatus]
MTTCRASCGSLWADFRNYRVLAQRRRPVTLSPPSFFSYRVLLFDLNLILERLVLSNLCHLFLSSTEDGAPHGLSGSSSIAASFQDCDGHAFLRAVAGSPTPSQSLIKACRQRVFEIASDAYIAEAAYELADLIEGSEWESSSILHAIQFLVESGIGSDESSRTIVLIAEEVYWRLEPFDSAVAEVFKTEMASVAIDRLTEMWTASVHSDLTRRDGELGVSENNLLRISEFVGDLYSIGFIDIAQFADCVMASVMRCSNVEHLLCLLPLLSRASTNVGPRLPVSFYAEVSTRLEEREYIAVKELISELIDEGLDIGSLHGQYCTIPWRHIVNPSFHPAKMTIQASDHLQQMQELRHGASQSPCSSSGSITSPSTTFANAMDILENRTKRMTLTDDISSEFSEETTDEDSLSEPEMPSKDFDYLSALDVDFEESIPIFVREGLHLSLNDTVPSSLTTPLPTREDDDYL